LAAVQTNAEDAMPGNDPLLQPFQLKHLTLKNRLMTSSHEPAYTDDGMPKERYRLYHAARARAGLAMTRSVISSLTAKRLCRGCASWSTVVTSTTARS
jgi:2,4-dienoyl-CoA reductase-like NADH-dependent reductase (Old Yellow Enzyme family)